MALWELRFPLTVCQRFALDGTGCANGRPAKPWWCQNHRLQSSSIISSPLAKHTWNAKTPNIPAGPLGSGLIWASWSYGAK